MTDSDRELGLQDEDRLPWLEAVEDDDDDDHVDGAKMLGFVLAALAALGLVVGGTWWLRSSDKGPKGDGTLIAAQEGDYKVKPDAPGGMKVEGQGDAAFKASEGAEADGKVDTNAQPEAPVAATKAVAVAKPVVTPAAKPSVTQTLPAVAARPMPKPMTAPPVAAAGGGAAVQLGAYGSAASAETAWTMLSQHHAELASLAKSVVPAAVGGNTVYRLRAATGSPGAAAGLCGKLKSSGASCMVVN
jgi:SPOR domain